MTQERELIRLALRILGESTNSETLFHSSKGQMFGLYRCATFLGLQSLEFREIDNAMTNLYYGKDLLEFWK